MDNRQRIILNNLLQITEGCRDDMHEPDEQGLSAHVFGTSLDNSFGADIVGSLLDLGHHEIIVVLKRENGMRGRFNLADLIALARMAQ